MHKEHHQTIQKGYQAQPPAVPSALCRAPSPSRPATLLAHISPQDNLIRGRFLAELTREVFSDLEQSKYQHAEMRISIYGRKQVGAALTDGYWWGGGRGHCKSKAGTWLLSDAHVTHYSPQARSIALAPQSPAKSSGGQNRPYVDDRPAFVMTYGACGVLVGHIAADLQQTSTVL